MARSPPLLCCLFLSWPSQFACKGDWSAKTPPWDCPSICLVWHFGLQRKYSTHVQPGGSLATPVVSPNYPITTTLRPKMAGNMAAAVAATAARCQPRRQQSRLRCQTFGTSKWETGPSCVPRGSRGLSVIGTSAGKRPAEVFGIYGAGCRAACRQHSLTVSPARRTCLYPRILPRKDGARNMRARRHRHYFAGAYDVTS